MSRDPGARMGGSRWIAVALVLFGAAALPTGVQADDPAGAAGETGAAAQAQPEAAGSINQRIAAIRDDLVAARFEKVLAAVEAMLGEPGMPKSARSELLVLRSQAHVAFGDLDAAEEDFRQILRVRPEYVPDASLTSKKAMDRFSKVQAGVVAKLKVTLDPPDARLSVDSLQVALPTDGLLTLLAGEHRLAAQHDGFDPDERIVELVAGQQESVEIRLVPNSRTVVLRTEPDGVEVLLDGKRVGVTARPEGLYGSNPPPGELVIENVPLGDHRFELHKECFRDELLTDSLNVDLLQRTPKRYEPVVLVPASATLTLRGGPAGAEVVLDGKPAGRLPQDSFEVCPGTREVVLRLDGRVVWRSAEELRESVELSLDVVPRPNAVIVGADTWPDGFERFSVQFSTLDPQPLPPSADLSQPSGWKEVTLPRDTDVALAVVPASREGLHDKWYLYSPILRAVEELDVAPPDGPRPAWHVSAWGFAAVDSEIGGPARVVQVFDGGPAAAAGLAPGDRIVSAGGLAVSGTSDMRTALRAASVERPLELQWQTAAGEAKQGTVQGIASPHLVDEYASREAAMTAAAWAVLDAACRPSDPAALANLALLFAEFGHHDLAAETWRRIRWGDRAGVGEGTTQYYLGRELEQLGREQEAVQAYTRAAKSAATAYRDFGPPVAPAAIDRLADLGVTAP